MAILFGDSVLSPFDFQQALEAFRASDWLESGPSAAGTYPPLNVFRKDDSFVLIAELPGINKSDLDIQVKGGTVRIAGKKTVGGAEKAAAHRRERLSGSFDRAVTLPIEIDADQVRAEYRDGILALYLPRTERDKPKLVKVS